MALPRGVAKTTTEEEEASDVFWFSDMDVGGFDSVLPGDQFWTMFPPAGAGWLGCSSNLYEPSGFVPVYTLAPVDFSSLRTVL